MSIYSELEILVKKLTAIIDRDPRKPHRLKLKDYSTKPSLETCVKYLDKAYSLHLHGSHQWYEANKLRLLRNHVTHMGPYFDQKINDTIIKVIKEIAIDKQYAALITANDEWQFESNPDSVIKASKDRTDVPREPFTAVFLEGFLEHSLNCFNAFLSCFFEELHRWDGAPHEV